MHAVQFVTVEYCNSLHTDWVADCQQKQLSQDADLLTRERLHRGLGLFDAALLRIQVATGSGLS